MSLGGAQTLTPGNYTVPSTLTQRVVQPVSVGPPVPTGAPMITSNGSTTNGAGAALAADAAAVTAWANPTSWCLPLIIYVIFAIIGFIWMLSGLFSSTNTMSTGNKWVSLIISLLWLIFFGWLIYYLCRKGHQGWAWFVLFLPLIVLAVFYLFIAGAIGAFWAGYDVNKAVAASTTEST
jgi:hypothetical protein